MKDILEKALENEHIEMVIWLLKNDRRLMGHKLNDGSTLKDRLIQLNAYEFVLSKIQGVRWRTSWLVSKYQLDEDCKRIKLPPTQCYGFRRDETLTDTQHLWC